MSSIIFCAVLKLRQWSRIRQLPRSGLVQRYNEIAAILVPFCEEHLNEEYKGLCVHALEKLCRKRPSPLNEGRARTWAAGIIHAVGTNNFLFDKSQKVYMAAKDLAENIGVSSATCSSKGKDIAKMLKINYANPEWVLPSKIMGNPALWYVELDGMMVDARSLPLSYQIYAYDKGYIPFVPALEQEKK